MLRVYPHDGRSDADIRLEAGFMSALREHGLPVPAVIPATDGQPLVSVSFVGKRWQAVLMDHVAGAHPARYTPALVDHMADLHARMHVVGTTYGDEQGVRRDHTALREDYYPRLVLASGGWPSRARELLTRARDFTVELADALPDGLIHRDYDKDNVLTDGDRVTAILDFGDLIRMPLVVCLGYALWDVLFEDGGSPELASRYLNRYQRTRRLEPAELGVLPAVVLYRHYLITAVSACLGEFGAGDLDLAERRERELRAAQVRLGATGELRWETMAR